MTPDPPSCQLNQHLKDSLCQQLLQLDEVSILGPGASSSSSSVGGEGEAEGGDGERDLEQQVRGDLYRSHKEELVSGCEVHSPWTTMTYNNDSHYIGLNMTPIQGEIVP